MKYYIATAFLIFSIYEAHADQNFDLQCAVMAGAHLAIYQKGSPEQTNALEIELFYLGRLTARDDSKNWKAIIAGRLAEQQAKAIDAKRFAPCISFVAEKMI